MSSVNLVGKFSTELAQDDMLREIIRNDMKINLYDVHDRNGKNKNR